MITTIITTYRRPLLLKRAVNSVLKQTYPHFQVCVYDNDSNDETTEIMQDFVKKDSRVKYHRHPKNIGMMANYEFAYQRIETPFFSLLSDDDFLLPHFYEIAIEGFQKFPDAAFSACGILILDEKGNYIADPLSLWSEEGYYNSPKGLFEMIQTRWKFPVPTGVVFQNKFVRSVHPDYSKDIELFWDPDYLLRIAARFPIVIIKRCCGIYLAHLQSFANSFYSNLLNDVSSVEKYLKATNKVMSKIKENTFLTSKDKNYVKRLFSKYVQGDVIGFLDAFIKHKKLGGVHFLSKEYYRYFGFSFSVSYYHVMAILLKCFPFLKTWLKSLAWTKRFFDGLIRKKYENPLLIKTHNSINLEELRKCHEYGQQLFNENV